LKLNKSELNGLKTNIVLEIDKGEKVEEFVRLGKCGDFKCGGGMFTGDSDVFIEIDSFSEAGRESIPEVIELLRNPPNNNVRENSFRLMDLDTNELVCFKAEIKLASFLGRYKFLLVISVCSLEIKELFFL